MDHIIWCVHYLDLNSMFYMNSVCKFTTSSIWQAQNHFGFSKNIKTGRSEKSKRDKKIILDGSQGYTVISRDKVK